VLVSARLGPPANGTASAMIGRIPHPRIGFFIVS
jgi:hypothetical protein